MKTNNIFGLHESSKLQGVALHVRLPLTKSSAATGAERAETRQSVVSLCPAPAGPPFVAKAANERVEPRAIAAQDADGDAVTFALDDAPAGATLTPIASLPNRALLSWTLDEQAFTLHSPYIRLEGDEGRIAGDLKITVPLAADQFSYMDLRVGLSDGNAAICCTSRMPARNASAEIRMTGLPGNKSASSCAGRSWSRHA